MKKEILHQVLAVSTALAAATGTTAAQSFNPTAAAKGFNVFTTGALTIVGGDTHGPLAIGGNLILAGNAPLAMNTSGTYPTNTLNSTGNYGLVINGRVQYNSGGSPTYVSNGLVRLGNTTGTTLYDYDNNNATTGLQLTSGAFNSTPRVGKQNGWQNKTTATQAHGLDFTAAAAQITQASALINGYATTNCQGKINTIPVPTCNSCNPQLPLESTKVNFMDITTQAQLTGLLNVGSLNLMSASGVKPTADGPMIFNVTIAGAVTFTVPNMSSVSGSDGRFILWNFPNATSISFGNGAYNNTVYGTILAPQAALVKDGGNNFEGQVLASSFSLNTGEVHYQVFAALLPQCGTALSLEDFPLAATRQGANVRVDWKSVGAKDATLNIERSADGERWSTVAADVRGESFTDASAPQSSLHYRIRTQGADGSVRYSSVASISDAYTAEAATVSPNPFTSMVSVNGLEDAATATLSDAAGRVVAKQSAVGGVVRFTGMDALPAGVYFIRATSSTTGVTVRKVVKQ